MSNDMMDAVMYHVIKTPGGGEVSGAAEIAVGATLLLMGAAVVMIASAVTRFIVKSKKAEFQSGDKKVSVSQ